MTRPNSIIWFERVFLGSMLLSLVNSALTWSSLSEQMAATPGAATLGGNFLIGTMAVGIVINLLLWYFIARRGSNVARIIWTVLFAIGIFGVIAMFFQPTSLSLKIVPLISFALQGIGIFLLWRPDAKPWFAPNKENLENIFS
jgi:Na+-transporting NADH:ubiquinone oxidoreductase subunit NqrE